MKKSLVLAMAMAVGVTASAYAANPFSDVPAGHWAYDSVNKLAAAGIVDGYGNGTFGGDRLMTRYEMAQIVAKAMAKGANVDRLAAEFADELDSLGVRVAALEKNLIMLKLQVSSVLCMLTMKVKAAFPTIMKALCVPVSGSQVRSMTAGNIPVCCRTRRICLLIPVTKALISNVPIWKADSAVWM